MGVMETMDDATVKISCMQPRCKWKREVSWDDYPAAMLEVGTHWHQEHAER